MVVGDGVLGSVSPGDDQFWEFEVRSPEASSVAQIDISNVFFLELFIKRRDFDKELGDQVSVVVGKGRSD